MIKVSIVIPIYNVEKYIERCVQSVMNQTYSYIECIIVDDCTPDCSMNIIDKMLLVYDGDINFIILRHNVNSGLSVARNTGTHRASGDYVYYLDSDDEITSDCIERLVEMVNRYPGVEVVQGNTKTIPYTRKEGWRDISKKGFPLYVNDNLWCRKHFYNISHKSQFIPTNAWNKLIKLDFIHENNLYFERGIIHEDELWMFYLIKRVSSIAFCFRKVYIHYVVVGSIMQAKNEMQSLLSWYIILSKMFQDLDTDLNKQSMCKMLLSLLDKYQKVIRFENENLLEEYSCLMSAIARKEGGIYCLPFCVFNRLAKICKPIACSKIFRYMCRLYWECLSLCVK